MFCPNCGKECGTDRFCYACGTQLRKDPAPQPLPSRTNTQKGSPIFPINSSYIGDRRTYLDLNEASVTVSPTGGYDYRTTIPYDQLTTVIYLRPVTSGWGISSGALLFRGKANQHIPIPDVAHLAQDAIAVIVPPEKAFIFYHVFHALKAIAPPAADFQMITPAVKVKNLEKLAQGIDFDHFWDRYAPYRDRAMEAICDKHRVNRTAAGVMIDMAFDARQQLLYAADPLDAVRDLTYILSEKEKQNKNIQRLKSELRDIQTQQAIDDIRRDVNIITLNKMLDDE